MLVGLTENDITRPDACKKFWSIKLQLLQACRHHNGVERELESSLKALSETFVSL